EQSEVSVTLTISAFYAGFVGLLLLALSGLVVKNRLRARVSLGSGDDPQLERAVRAQANLAEYAPLTLLLMAILEVGGAAPWLLHGCGSIFLVSRVLHATGMANPGLPLQGRRAGIVGTWLVLLVLSLAAIVMAAGGIRSG
ncbi:MAG: MAPEG family protein, partial [Gammaproteobacteria bacterium]